MKYVLTLLLLFVLCLGCNRAEETRHKAAEKNQTEIVPALKNRHETHESPVSEFSHVIAAETEYYTTGPQQGRPPDGKFPAGTKLNVIEDAGRYTSRGHILRFL